jgi:hypothetical protein
MTSAAVKAALRQVEDRHRRVSRSGSAVTVVTDRCHCAGPTNCRATCRVKRKRRVSNQVPDLHFYWWATLGLN